MGIAWQNSSYNQPPHLGFCLPEYLGVDRAGYTTKTVNNAPDAPAEEPVDPSGSYNEQLAVPAEDKARISGKCYTGGLYGELTASTSNGYLKMRTGNNNNTMTFSVNEGFTITGIKVVGYSNNTSTTADRSITLTDICIDGNETSVLTEPVNFPGGTKGKTPATALAENFSATKDIVLKFDNSLITTGDVDPAGKNKQIFAIITFTYTIGTGIESAPVTDNAVPVIYDLEGRKVNGTAKGVVIINKKKVLVR